MSAFSGATLMITGGTGSFGNTVLKHFLTRDIGQIRIFSRDEKKQDDMRHELQAKHPEHAKKVKFYIGDVPGLARIMKEFIQNPTHYVACGEKGREYFRKHFTKEEHLKRLETLLQRNEL